jgi:transglutaminase/protease-like cytokinesis protein 3
MLLLVTSVSMAQAKRSSFAEIDWKVQFVEAPTLDSLSRALTQSYDTDLEKVRSIFRWITEHVSYKVRGPIYMRRPAPVYHDDPDDTAAVLKPLTERVALNVFKRREAVCDGYAKLFKTLCDYAGIPSEIINGYARTNFNQVGQRFLSNHSWNAVYIDSSWHLLDATWAAGVVSYRGDEFIRRYDDYYFMTPPEQFIRDHYPDELTWALMDNPPTLREFHHTPYKSQQFVKNKIRTFSPARGIIEATLGDEVVIVLDMADIDTNREEPDPLDTDTLLAASGKLVNLLPEVNGRKLSYRFPVTTDSVEWLNITYRNELVMRYRLDILRPDNDKQAVRKDPL